MNKSESIKSIAQALSKFQASAGKIIKKAENPFFKSKYADLPSILDEIYPLLKDANLVISQWPDGDGLTTLLIHPEGGEWIESTGTMHPVKQDPQSHGSAITYLKRYSICAILGLNVDTDDDGNAASLVQNKPTQDKKPWLNENTQEYLEAKQYMANCADKQAGMAKLMTKYAISKSTREKLLS